MFCSANKSQFFGVDTKIETQVSRKSDVLQTFMLLFVSRPLSRGLILDLSKVTKHQQNYMKHNESVQSNTSGWTKY